MRLLVVPNKLKATRLAFLPFLGCPVLKCLLQQLVGSEGRQLRRRLLPGDTSEPGNAFNARSMLPVRASTYTTCACKRSACGGHSVGCSAAHKRTRRTAWRICFCPKFRTAAEELSPSRLFFSLWSPLSLSGQRARGAGWCWGGGKVLTDGDAKARPAVASAGSVGATHRLAVWQTATWQVW